MRSKILKYTLIFAAMMMAMVAYAQNDPAHQLYLEAKKQSFNQNWGVAAELFQKLVDQYPGSSYKEEAMFWVGYCLEKDGDMAKAYNAFTRLQNEHPNSLWLDDAIQHKIMLAEKLAAKRGDQYFSFLRTQLYHQDVDIQYQAAMALGHLGDKTALATLESLRGRVQFDSETESVIAALRQADDVEDEAVFAEGVVGEFDSDADQPVVRINPREDRINYFPERRFEQYRSMTRRDNDWSREELIRFGLWHIVPTDAFDTFLGLDPEGKKEWLRIFWKKNDPTPTTIENEGLLEFERRVLTAHKSFDYFDNLSNFYYAPWDARGEIYIKFGSPAKRVRNNDGELWTYPQIDNVTFFIRPNVTNIFGRAIFISAMNNKSLRSGAGIGDLARWRRVHNDLIFKPGFYFTPKLDMASIKNFKLLTSRKRGPQLEFRYKMPANELALHKVGERYDVSYLESFVIFNDQMDEVKRSKTSRKVTIDKKMRKKEIEQTVRVDLEPGDYMLGLRIEDPVKKKIAIRKVEFQIKK